MKNILINNSKMLIFYINNAIVVLFSFNSSVWPIIAEGPLGELHKNEEFRKLWDAQAT